MSTAAKVMVLIDADNVTAEVIEQALELIVATHGAAHVRRAYCTPDAAVKQLKLFKKLSIRPMVNIASGKNCTDIALAIDAIDLAVSERPDVFVIVSSDSDYAPLVLRLREKGCRVEGIGQEGKTSEDTKPVYDAFIDLAHRKPKTTRAAAAKAVREPKPKADSAPRAPRSARGSRTAAAKAAPPAPPPPPPKPALPDDVQAILQAMPELRDGAWVALRVAAEPLRQARLLGKTVSSTKLFKKHPALFRLEPEDQPSRVCFLGAD